MKYIIILFLFVHFTSLSFAQKADKIVVFFKFDSSILEVKSKNDIDENLQNVSFNQVYIETYCDSFGTIEYNYKLALRRANSIKEYLTQNNIIDTIIKIHAIGEELPKSNSKNNTLALNRRGELIFKQFSVTKNTVSEKSIEDSTSFNLKKDTSKIDSTVNLPSNDELNLDINKFDVGKIINLNNINFYPGRHELLPESMKTLDLLLKILKENPELKIEIQGHVCCIAMGDGLDLDTRTWNLSVNRAKEIYDYLIKKGINKSKLKYKGFGANPKIASDETELGRKTNRRVEIKILNK